MFSFYFYIHYNASMQNIDLPFLVDLQMFHNCDYDNILVSYFQIIGNPIPHINPLTRKDIKHSKY